MYLFGQTEAEAEDSVDQLLKLLQVLNTKKTKSSLPLQSYEVDCIR